MKPDRGGLTVGDPAVLRGKTIGVNPDVLQTTEGKAWLAERGIDVTYKDYATGDEVFSALSSGEVDAIIMNDALSSDDAMPMFYVGESDYYFTVPKSHPDIMAELDAAMTQILTSNPRYPDADIVMCDNTTACFDALSSGRAGCNHSRDGTRCCAFPKRPLCGSFDFIKGHSSPAWTWCLSASWRFLCGRCFARAKRSRKLRPRAVRKPRSSRA